MNSNIVVLPQAKADIVAIRDFIAHDSPRAAQRFYFALEEAFELLARMPEMAARCEFRAAQLPDLRVWSVPKFKNHLIFYRPIENGIEVVRVLHGARDLESLFE